MVAAGCSRLQQIILLNITTQSNTPIDRLIKQTPPRMGVFEWAQRDSNP